MSAPRVFILVSVLTLLAPGRACAQWWIAPFIGMKFAGDTSFVDPERAIAKRKLTLGGSVGRLGEGVFGFEGDFGLTPRFFECGDCPLEVSNLVANSNVATLTGNVIIAVPRRITGESLRPYLIGGAGWLHVRIDDIRGAFPVNSNLFGFDVGGGVIGPLTRRTSLRLDFRQFRNISEQESSRVIIGPTARISFWRASAGIMVRY